MLAPLRLTSCVVFVSSSVVKVLPTFGAADESLRGGQVKVFDSKYGLGSNLPASTSETGSFNTRAELA